MKVDVFGKTHLCNYLHCPPIIRQKRDNISQLPVNSSRFAGLKLMCSKVFRYKIAGCRFYMPQEWNLQRRKPSFNVMIKKMMHSIPRIGYDSGRGGWELLSEPG